MAANILKLSVPITIGQLVTLLYNVADRAFIGQMPGTGQTAMAGIGLTFPVVTGVAAFTALFSTGGVSLFSIERGKGHHETCGRILWITLVSLTVTGLVLTGLLYFWMKPLLFAFGASQDTWPFTRDYLDVALISTVFLMVGSGLTSFISAMSFAKTAMTLTCFGALLNLCMDPIFIYTWNMGITGAAWSTVISQVLSGIGVLWFLRSGKSLYPIRPHPFSWSLFRQTVTLGMAGFVMQVTNCINQVVCSRTLARYGSDLYISILTVVNSVRELMFMPMNGIASGAQPVLGFNYGAGQPERVRKGINILTVLEVGWALLAWGLVHLSARQILATFTSAPEVITTGEVCLKVYFAGFFMMAFMSSGQSVFGGLGLAPYAIFFSTLRKLIVVVPLTLLLPRYYGVMGVFMAEPVSNFVGGIACHVTMRIKTGKLLRKGSES